VSRDGPLTARLAELCVSHERDKSALSRCIIETTKKMYEFSTQRQAFSSIVSQFCDAGRSEPLSLAGQEANRKPRKSGFRMTFRSHSFLALLLLH